MASETKNIAGITRGNDVEIEFTITTSVAIVSARLMGKHQKPNADSAAVFDKLVTSTLTANGQITTPGPPSAIIKFIFSKTETQALVAGVPYEYDLEVFDGSSKATTPLGGTFTLVERVRIAVG